MQTKFKRIITSALALVLSFSISSCHRNNETEESTTTEKATTTTEETKENTTTKKTTTATTTEARLPYAYPLTGVPTDVNVEEEELPVLAFMIDNHPAAQPHAGTSMADIVIEQKVEGQYSRLMIIMQSQKPDKIGPIRSSRYNFIERLAEFDAVYFHVGGSGEALNYIRNNSWIKDVDGMAASTRYLWRDNSEGHYIPHNVFTTYSRAKEAAVAYGYGTDAETPDLKFNYDLTEPEHGASAVNEFNIAYNNLNVSQYKYDQASGTYKRSKNGQKMMDSANGKQVAPTNVIAQFASSYIQDDYGHRGINQIGTGGGYLFTAGKKVDITWKKDSLHDLTRFYYQDSGEEIVLNPGQTWIETVEGSGNVNIIS